MWVSLNSVFTQRKYISMIPYYGMYFKQSKVNSSTIWQTIWERSLQIPWHIFVWSKFSISKLSFIFWLPLKNRLLTKDRMLRFSMDTDPLRVLCRLGYEFMQHLFSNCPYFDMIRQKCHVIVNNAWAWCQTRDIFIAALKFMFQMASLYLAVAIYNSRKERNLRMYDFTENLILWCSLLTLSH